MHNDDEDKKNGNVTENNNQKKRINYSSYSMIVHEIPSWSNIRNMSHYST